MSVPIALTIAGSDSSGGAGIEADLKTFSALGVYGACIVTAVTAQNTKGVSAIHAVPADIVAAQIDAVFSDLDVGATKIGMLVNASISRSRRCRPRSLSREPQRRARSDFGCQHRRGAVARRCARCAPRGC